MRKTGTADRTDGQGGIAGVHIGCDRASGYIAGMKPRPVLCANCGAEVHGHYCSNCGEKPLHDSDLTIGHFFSEIFHVLTHAEGKLWASLKALVRQPGTISLAYMNGPRKRYMKPVTLFFVANLIYFLFPIFETFNTSLHSQIELNPYSGWIAPMVHRHLERSGTAMEGFDAVYNAASKSNAKLMLVGMVFFLALPMALVYRGKQRFASGHVTGAFELMAFHLYLTTILLSFVLYSLTWLMVKLGNDPDILWNDNFMIVLMFLLNSYFCYQQGRRFHHCSVPGAAWRAIAMFFGFALALVAYRLLLFFVTFWQVG